MFCKYCGNETRPGQRFCGKCGRAIALQAEVIPAAVTGGKAPKGGKRKPYAIGVCAALAVLLAGALIIGGSILGKESSSDLFEQYARVDGAVSTLATSYADDNGYTSPESAQELIDSIADYASDSADVTDFETRETGLCLQLSSGLLYVYSPAIEHYLSGGSECRLVTYEPWWTDVQDVTSLRSTADVPGMSDASEIDSWANYVADELANCSFTQQDNYNDGSVDIDALKGFGTNEFVVYYGHGNWFDKTQGSILSTGTEFNQQTAEEYADDISAGRIGYVDGRLFVTPAFFEHYYSSGSLNGSNFFLLACKSLHDEKLARTLTSKGADVVVGFTHSVTIDYGTRMLETMLGVDARIGLTDKSSAGEYFTFSEALDMAREVNGEVDTFWDAYWPWDLAKRAKCECFPAEAASQTRISSARERSESEGDSLEAFSGNLAAKDYSVEYLYRARGYANNPNFEWVVSDDLPDGAVVGTQIADYDGDGDEELLAVLWRNDTVDFDMYEVDGGAVRLAASMSDAATLAFPVKGNGALDVATDSDGALFMQWWYHTAPVADVHEWVVMRVDYDGKRFRTSDSANVAGTGMLSLKELKSDMQGLGLNTAYVPDEDFGEFTASSIADLDPTLRLVARATAWVDNEVVAGTAFREMQSGSASWGELKYLGEFRIGSGVTSERQQGAKDSQAGNAKSESGSSENDLKSAVTSSAKHEILHWFYADFDADGDSEAFAVTGVQDEQFENEWSDGEVWYADEQGVKRLGGQEAGNAINGLVEDAASGYKFLSLEHDAHGSGTTSSVFVASNGSCVEAQFDLTHVGAFHEEDGQLVGYSNKWDNGFHEYEWHSFKFDPIALTFKSTGVVDVTTWR